MLGAGAVLLAAAIVALVATGSHESSRTAAAAATSDVLATIDPATNRITQRFPVGDTPTVVTVGASAAWTINADGRTVSRVDLRTHAVTTIAPGTIPLDIVAGEDAPWLVSAHDPRAGTLDYPTPDTLARLDPVSGAPDRSLSLLPRQGHGYGGSKQSVAVGGDAVWTIGPTGWLHRVDLRSPDSSILRRLVAVAVATGDGQVWVLVEPPSDKPHAANLLRLAPRSGRVIAHLRVPSDSLGTIAVGAGAVWLTDDFAGGVWRVDPHLRSAPRIIAVDQGVDGIAAAHGAAWTTNSLAGTVARIDAATNHVDTLAVGGTPRGVAIGAGSVWVTVADTGRNLAAAGSLSPNARVKPVTERDCGPVLAGRVANRIC